MELLFNANGHVTGVADGIDIRAYAIEIGGILVEMNGDQPSIDHEAYPDGEWRLPYDFQVKRENQWRAIEMSTAKENVTAIDFGDDTIPGTAAQWKGYWLTLRDWKDGNTDFPDMTKRPVRPA